MTTYISPEEWQALSEEERHDVERDTLFRHLAAAGEKAARTLRERLVAGTVDGSYYFNEDSGCGCILGTLVMDAVEDPTFDRVYDRAKALRGDDTPRFAPDFGDAYDGYHFVGNYDVVEALAMNVEAGDTPETSANVRLLVGWVDEWLAARAT